MILFPIVGILSFILCLAHILWISGNTGLGDLTSAFLLRFRSDTSRIPAHELKHVTFSWPSFCGAARAGHGSCSHCRPYCLRPSRFGTAGDIGVPTTGSFLCFCCCSEWRIPYSSRKPPGNTSTWCFTVAHPPRCWPQAACCRSRPQGDLRVIAAFAAAFAAIAVPQIHDLHRPPTKPNEVLLGALMAIHTHPNELILTNDWKIKSPQVQYYSSRDNFDSDDAFGPEVATVEELERQLRARPNRPTAVVISERDPGAEDLQAWLEPRSTSEEVFLGDRCYRIFRRSTNSLPRLATGQLHLVPAR